MRTLDHFNINSSGEIDEAGEGELGELAWQLANWAREHASDDNGWVELIDGSEVEESSTRLKLMFHWGHHTWDFV